MDFALGMMMTAVGLFQEAETPLGHVATLDPLPTGPEGAQNAPEAQQGGQQVSESVAAAFGALERLVGQRGLRPDELYDRMRQAAARFEGQRSGGNI